MNASIKKHFWYYLSLAVMLLVCLAIAFMLSYNTMLQILALFAGTCFYILWGIVHQQIHHHLTPKIMLEYVLMGSLGFVLIVFLIQM